MCPTERNIPESMVGRVSLVLGAFGPDDEDLGISEIARRTGLAKATVSRIARELIDYEFLERRGTSVRLGLRIFELGSITRRPKDLRRLALATMADLRQATGHTVHLAVREGREVVYIEILRGRDGVQLPSRVGGRMPAHATGVGKALLAYTDPAIVDEILSSPLEQVGPRTFTSPTDLRVELESVRTHGLAYEQEESAAGVCCVAGAILRENGDPLAAISVSGPNGTMRQERVGPAVQAATLGLNRLIRNNTLLNRI
ncbi:IclR family transcriptional regulator [Arthrobacter sp. BHU FT2]|nr:IclR family transcriptional regulator [Arthrobacter sp. BHU FT2]